MKRSIAISLGIIIFLFFVGYFLKQSPDQFRESTICNSEAKICPDGSTVGRSGPNCEFTACPGDNRPSRVSCTKERKICPDGSGVSRIPPNCDFADCPNIATSSVADPASTNR